MSEKSPASDSSSKMSKISFDIPTNRDNINSKACPPRRYSTGNSSLIPSEPNPLPNYLRASIGSCHDFCKYGIKRDFHIKKKPPPSPKHEKNEHMLQKERSEKYYICGKMAAESSKLVAASPKQQPKLKPFGSRRPIVQQGNKTFLKNSSNVRISRKDANKDARTSKINKKNDFLQSSVKVSTPTNKTRKHISQLGIKRSVETDQRKSCENVVPEKIIHVIELKEENRDKNLALNLSSKQSQKMHSLAENRTSLRRVVSEGDFIDQKIRNDYEKGVLRRRIVEERKSNPNLMNSVIEEAASKLVKMRKSKVKALVGAFESVIKIQDCGSPRTS